MTVIPETILLFGGSFDPPHNAHIMLPRLAMDKIGADRVAYLPTSISPFKTDTPPAPAAHRLAMLRCTLQDQPWATIFTDELDIAGDRPAYTIDTLEHIRARLGEAADLRLLIGADQVRSFHEWREAQRVRQLAPPVVMLRPPDNRDRLLASFIDGAARRFWEERIVELPAMDISSTLVRDHVAAGRPIAHLVPAEVEAYIRKHHLYGA